MSKTYQVTTHEYEEEALIDEEMDDLWLHIFLILADLANQARLRPLENPTDLAKEAYARIQELDIC
jgi:hypothetical protein